MGDSVVTPQFFPALLLLAAFAATLACGARVEPVSNEPPSHDVTSWTEKSELYMEYPPLATAHQALFAVHLTTLDDFEPLDSGTPSIELIPEGGGTPTVLAGVPSSSPGAFRVEGIIPAAGRYRMALAIEAPGLNDRHDLGLVTVFDDEAAAWAAAEAGGIDDPAAVAYLKEQQWTNEFATSRAVEAELRRSIRVPASIEPLSGGEAIIAAPSAGRFAAESLAPIGARIPVGHVLGRLEPRLGSGDDRSLLASEMAQAQIALEGARAEQVRAEALVAERAVPARRLEEARRATSVAEARLEAASVRLAQRDETLTSGGGAASGNAYVLRAPIAGRVAEVFATLGASYEEGAPLFKIVRTDRVRLRAQVSAADVAAARVISEIALEVGGRPDPITLEPERTRDAGMIDPRTGALPILFDVENPRGELLLGQNGTAVLYTSDRLRMLTVPNAAVLFAVGRPYVWIQVGGEEFLRRYIEIAARDGEVVGLRSGVTPGDRVVVRGAYDLQLASAARGLPAEGHVH